jgi:hypothetical protein
VPNGKHTNDALLVHNIITVCREFHKFPEDGGLLDQDIVFVHLLNNYMVWQSQKEELESRKQSRAVQRSP